ncbi:hypothetical protein F2Q69_00004909 [Brassica cretica]|uniref:No apical meristem-associated C-terminal domain-containing protein n=1 Tax=Brassica cretica TaxID=69181 RepID=A0A8S9P7Z3_BRACR|nr:hypothetical protein F2Q69_00004909 [Brassica cretica]
MDRSLSVSLVDGMNADSLPLCGSPRRRGPAISLWLFGNLKFDSVSHNGDRRALCWWVSSYRSDGVIKSLSSCSVERDVRKVHRTKDFNCFSASESVNAHVDVDDDGTNRPPGVKAAKTRRKKKPMVEGKEVSDFQTMWELKKEDLVRKERVVKLRLLEKLLGKKKPLSDADEGALESLVALESQEIVTDCPVSPLVVSRSVVVSCTLVL